MTTAVLHTPAEISRKATEAARVYYVDDRPSQALEIEAALEPMKDEDRQLFREVYEWAARKLIEAKCERRVLA